MDLPSYKMVDLSIVVGTVSQVGYGVRRAQLRFLQGVLSSKQLQPALSGALATLRSLTPRPEPAAEVEPGKSLVAAVGLVKCLGGGRLSRFGAVLCFGISWIFM